MYIEVILSPPHLLVRENVSSELSAVNSRTRSAVVAGTFPTNFKQITGRVGPTFTRLKRTSGYLSSSIAVEREGSAEDNRAPSPARGAVVEVKSRSAAAFPCGFLPSVWDPWFIRLKSGPQTIVITG